MAVLGCLRDVLRRHSTDDEILRGLRYLEGLSPALLENKPSGFHEREAIEGERLFALHQVYETRDPAAARYEGHRRYADLQYVHAGRERIRVRSLRPGETGDGYDPAKDIAFYPLGDGADLNLAAGMVAIFFPEDLHAPGLHQGSPSTVRKTVVKVEL